MKMYVLMFQQITGEWVSVYHVTLIPLLDLDGVLQFATECLLAGKCDGRYVCNRCVVYCLEDHSMVELVCKDGSVEVFN